MLEYKLIEGKPAVVERVVNSLIKNGWELNGDVMPRQEDGVDLIVQPMKREPSQMKISQINTFGVISDMCLTYRHDYGLLTTEEQEPIFAQMAQIYDNCLKPYMQP